MRGYNLSSLEFIIGLTLIILSFGRTFEVNNVFLDVIFGLFGVISCILGGYTFKKTMDGENNG